MRSALPPYAAAVAYTPDLLADARAERWIRRLLLTAALLPLLLLAAARTPRPASPSPGAAAGESVTSLKKLLPHENHN